jgi:16S rRNA (guanine(1405)-N(7))-methyltransferase
VRRGREQSRAPNEGRATPDVSEIVAAVVGSRRYHDIDAALIERVAAGELAGARSLADAVKRTKRRLHQAVGAFRPSRTGVEPPALELLTAAWHGRLDGPAFKDECAALLERHASTRERVPHLGTLYAGIWAAMGDVPRSILDLGCGVGPLALPWMGLSPGARYVAVDVDRRSLALVDGFLGLVDQPHAVIERDLVATDPPGADGPPWITEREHSAALLLKLIPTLDRQDLGAVARVLATVDVAHAVVSFPGRSLGGRGRGMERTYRARMDALLDAVAARIASVAEASIPGELIFVLSLAPPLPGMPAPAGAVDG